MRIKLNGLRGMGEVEICDEISPSDLHLNKDEFDQPVGLRIKLQETADCIEGKLRIYTVTHRLCDRCAIEMNIPLIVEQNLTFVREGSRERKEESEDIIFYRADSPSADISQNIRDAVLLAVPMRILCKEDCKGLCPKCGADLNYEKCECVEEMIDPRLAKLAELKLKMNDE